MGKKYKAVTVSAPYNFELEPMFEFTVYEGMKPSRAVAVVKSHNALRVLEQDMRAERLTNWKPSSDKPGRRPIIEVEDIEDAQDFEEDVPAGNWGLVLEDGRVIHECEYRTYMGRVIGTIKRMWSREKYAHLPVFEFNYKTRRAQI